MSGRRFAPFPPSAFVRHFFRSTDLVCLLQMFFSQLSHAEILEPPSKHPMVKRIVGSELVGLIFIQISFVKLARRARCASKLVIDQHHLRVALQGVGPNRNSFLPTAELPKR